MNDYDAYFENPDVVTSQDRLAELEQEILHLKGGKGSDNMLMQLIQNPKMIRQNLDMTPQQAKNVKAIMAAAGTGAAVRFLGGALGDTIAGALGGGLSGYLAKRIFG